jgi:hypothetical protein
MMGNTTAATIRAELYTRFAKGGKDPVQQVRHEVNEARRKSPERKTFIETLQFLLDTLRTESRRLQKAKTRAKRKSAVTSK